MRPRSTVRVAQASRPGQRSSLDVELDAGRALAWHCDPVAIAPIIRAVQWIPARDVLGGEASDFTPWLQQPESMSVLGTALKLEDLRAISVEHNVHGKRLDILAQATDENGEDIPVCIENQYGESDADHLGRLIAYLAQQERGRAVWIVEHAHDAYVAAVRFLNRTTTEDVGYYLAEVRFTHGIDGTYQVHFEVLAAPIDWERAGRRQRSARPVNSDRKEFLDAVLEAARPTILGAGCPSISIHKRGTYASVTWPLDLWARARLSRRFTVLATKADITLNIIVERFQSRAANTKAVEILRSHLSNALEQALPAETAIAWAAGQHGHREIVRLMTPGGWVAGDPAAAASWVEDAVTALLGVLRDHPIENLEALVSSALPDAAVSLVEEGDDEEDESPDG